MKIVLVCSIGLACFFGPSLVAAVETPPSLIEQVARELEQASPITDPSDARARDAAATRLADCQAFKAACRDRILWGGCEPIKGFDPRTYTLTEFEPLIWLKLYASTIMFTGQHEVRRDNGLTVLELTARFRSELDPGDYPYPFWHSPKKWQAYVDLTSLAVVFQGDQIIATYRIATPNPGKPAVARLWDGRWRWVNAQGQEQPRAALFSYVFGADNPHREAVERAYRQLEARFRGQNCAACHSPDNKGKAKELLLLNYPNQSLASRHKLVQILTENRMPPEDTETGHPAGIAEQAVRLDLIQLANVFTQEADAALRFESSRKGKALEPAVWRAR